MMKPLFIRFTVGPADLDDDAQQVGGQEAEGQLALPPEAEQLHLQARKWPRSHKEMLARLAMCVCVCEQLNS